MSSARAWEMLVEELHVILEWHKGAKEEDAMDMTDDTCEKTSQDAAFVITGENIGPKPNPELRSIEGGFESQFKKKVYPLAAGQKHKRGPIVTLCNQKDSKNSFGKEESSKKNEKERKKENDRETEEPQKTGHHLDQESVDRHR
uniref:Uncharacterized protein n=1 Tax=Tanacetum cinerariifolium TaxID=118510 RepID=A0A6L2MSS0_TANCI|nr:hypothetical protein [Tanacetum cinerariifolium]